MNLDSLETHSVPLDGYPMSHVFKTDDGALPPDEHLDQITPLNTEAAQFLWNFEQTIRLTTYPPDSGRYFRSTERFEFREGQTRELKKWLYHRGIPFRNPCYLSFQPDTAFILTWKMVVHYADRLFFAHDTVVWDRSLNWALYYDHNNIFHFAKDRIFDGEAEQVKLRGMQVERKE